MAKRKKKDAAKEAAEVVGFLGVGLDNQDGHTRLTRAEHFVLLGGSQDTHERMQVTAIHFSEELERKGKVLHEATLEEVLELLFKARDRSS